MSRTQRIVRTTSAICALAMAAAVVAAPPALAASRPTPTLVPARAPTDTPTLGPGEGIITAEVRAGGRPQADWRFRAVFGGARLLDARPRTGPDGSPAHWRFELTDIVLDVALTALPPRGFREERAVCRGPAPGQVLESTFRGDTLTFEIAPTADHPLIIACDLVYVGAGVPTTDAISAPSGVSDGPTRIAAAIVAGITAFAVAFRARRRPTH